MQQLQDIARRSYTNLATCVEIMNAYAHNNLPVICWQKCASAGLHNLLLRTVMTSATSGTTGLDAQCNTNSMLSLSNQRSPADADATTKCETDRVSARAVRGRIRPSAVAVKLHADADTADDKAADLFLAWQAAAAPNSNLPLPNTTYARTHPSTEPASGPGAMATVPAGKWATATAQTAVPDQEQPGMLKVPRRTEPRHMMARLKAATSVWQLTKILQESGEHYNSLHLAAFLHQLAVLVAGQSLEAAAGGLQHARMEWGATELPRRALPKDAAVVAVLQRAEDLLAGKVDEMAIGPMSSAVWALGKLHAYTSRRAVPLIMRRLCSELDFGERADREAPNNKQATPWSSADSPPTDSSGESSSDAAAVAGPGPGSERLARQARQRGQRRHLGRARTGPMAGMMEPEPEPVPPLVDAASAQDLANLSWGFARLGVSDARLWTWISSVALRRIQMEKEWEGRHLANLVWGYATAGISDRDLFNGVAFAIMSQPDVTFKPQELSMIMWAYASCGHTQEDFFVAMSAKAASMHRRFTPQQLALVMWSYGVADLYEERFFRRMAESISQKLWSFDHQGYCNVMWALARTGHKQPELYDALAAYASKHFRSMSVADAVNVAWSLTKLGYRDEQLVEDMRGWFIERLPLTDPPSLSRVAWVYASAGSALHGTGQEAAEFWEALKVQVMASLDVYDVAQLTTLCWAFAKKGHLSTDLLDALQAALLPRIPECSSQLLALLAWSVGRSAHSTPHLMDVIIKQATSRLSEFQLSELVTVLWAMGRVQHENAHFMEVMAEHIVKQIRGISVQGLVNTAWAFARLNHAHDDLFFVMAQASMAQISSFDEAQIDRLVWSYKQLKYSNSGLLQKVWDEQQV